MEITFKTTAMCKYGITNRMAAEFKLENNKPNLSLITFRLDGIQSSILAYINE